MAASGPDRSRNEIHPVRRTLIRSRADRADIKDREQYQALVIGTGSILLSQAAVPDLLGQFRDDLREKHPDIKFPGFTDWDLKGEQYTQDHNGVIYRLTSEGRVVTRIGWDYFDGPKEERRNYEYAGIEVGVEPLSSSIIVFGATNIETIASPIWESRNGRRILTAAIGDAIKDPNYYERPEYIG